MIKNTHRGEKVKRTVQEDEFIKKRKARQKKIRKRRIIRGFLLFFILLIIAGAALSLTVLFPIKTVKAGGSKIYTAEQLAAASGIKKGDNLFTASVDEEALKYTLPYVESVKIKRTLPDTVTVTVTDAREYACYYTDGSYYAVSRSGHVLNCYDSMPDGIFEIRAPDVKCEVGREIKLSDEKSGELIEEILGIAEELKINITCLDITDELAITLKAENRFTVNLGTANYLENKLAHLSGMLKSIGSEKTGKINLSMWSDSHTEGTFVEENPE